MQAKGVTIISDTGDKKQKILDYYNVRLEHHGKSPRALDWGSKEVQEKRFEILLAIGDVENCRILDVGCGLGDLYRYLTEKGIKCEYVGYDINPRFIESCRESYPEAKFEVVNIMDEKPSEAFDYVVTSGMFNLGFEGDLDLIEQVFVSFYNAASSGVGCNFTSTLGDFQNPEVDYFEPAEIARMIQKTTRNFVVRHDYLPHDFTIYAYK
jgi:SAM-dependent methyltransferase